MWFLPGLSTYIINYRLLNLSQNLLKNIDIGWGEFYKSYRIYGVIKDYSIIFFIYQLNNFKIFLFRFVLWVIIFIFVLILYLNSLNLEHNIEDIKVIFNLWIYL